MALAARRVARIHKIVGLAAGLLFLSWTASGLFFSLFPIETIRGDPWRPVIEHGDLAQMRISVSAQEVLDQQDEPVIDLQLTAFLDRPVWLLQTASTRQMIDAGTGVVRSPLSREEIDAVVARFDDRPEGLGTQTVIYRIDENPLREYAGPLPAWVVEYEPGKQRIYLDAVTGQVHTVRTTRWRIFDVLWRFHILDVTGQDRIDAWWLKLAAFLGLTMVLSGLILIVDRLRKGRLLG